VLAHRAVDVQRWVATHRWANSLLLRHLDPEAARRIVPGGARLVWTTRCPRLNIFGDVGLIGSAHFRRHLRQLQRKSQAAGVSFRWIGPERITANEIDMLFDLHEKRPRPERPSSFLRSRSAVFHRKLVDWAGLGRGPAMALAECGGVAVAAWYGFLWGHTFSLYQAGWDPAYAKLEIGTLLLAETIRLAALNNVRVFDFLRGAESYKYRFGATDALDETWLLPRHISGLLLQGKFRTMGKLSA
jgi:CelD/BcsL family acetyltransferase involved in cellulose biosynthesis